MRINNFSNNFKLTLIHFLFSRNDNLFFSPSVSSPRVSLYVRCCHSHRNHHQYRTHIMPYFSVRCSMFVRLLITLVSSPSLAVRGSMELLYDPIAGACLAGHVPRTRGRNWWPAAREARKRNVGRTAEIISKRSINFPRQLYICIIRICILTDEVQFQKTVNIIYFLDSRHPANTFLSPAAYHLASRASAPFSPAAGSCCAHMRASLCVWLRRRDIICAARIFSLPSLSS